MNSTYEIARLRGPQALARVKAAQPPPPEKDGLSAQEIRAELQKFSERLHEYSLTEEGQQACQAEWNEYWNGLGIKRSCFAKREATLQGLWEGIGA